MAGRNSDKTNPAGGKKKKGGELSPKRWLPSAPEKGGVAAVLAVALVVMILAGVLSGTGVLTPSRASSTAQLRISALMSSNAGALITEAGEVPDWIEVENAGDEGVDLRHYGLMVESDPTDMYCFPAMVLAPGEKVTVLANNSLTGGADGLEAPFGLNASGGETLVLFDAQSRMVDSVLLPELNINETYVRGDDGEWSVVAADPAAGVHTQSDALEISEVMYSNTLYFPDKDGTVYDYVEVRNRSDRNVDLEGWFLSDSADSLRGWAFPGVTLAPGGQIAVHCSGMNSMDDPGHLHANFSLTVGETVFLSRPDGTTVSAVTLPLLETNTAYSLIDGKWSTDCGPTPNAPNTPDGAQGVREGLFSSRVYINEIMACATEQEYDWLEIYNASGETVNIGGYGVSDDASKPRKWQFPDGTHIGPGEYIVLCCSSLRDERIGGYMNTGFGLLLDGGYTMSLSDPSGAILDAFYVPHQYGGVSYGRSESLRGLYFFERGTPGASNSSAGYVGRAPKAEPSVPGGLYQSGDPFEVSLTAPAGGRIFYTLDSTDPDNSSTPYTTPIQISGTTILRTRVYLDNNLPSYIDTQSYLFDVQTQDGVYIVSLVSDPDNLTGPERGIMVRGSGDRANYLQEWEREAHVELFTSDGKRVVGQGVDIGLHGMDTRKQPVKSFNVKASGAYGVSRINYPVFHERAYQDYSSILLRPSGEDYEMSFMRDTLLSSLMKDTDLLYQKWELGVLYLNGVYYTLHYIRERITPDAICQFHNWIGLEDSVEVLTGNGDSARHGTTAAFKSFMKQLKSTDTTTQAGYEFLDENIDIDNYIDYMCIELFSGNTDTLNRRFYRNTEADGKWRWALYDLDWAFFTDYDSMGKWLTPGGAGVKNMTDNTLFIACMKNPTFRDKFLKRFGELLAGPFCTENVLARIEERVDLLKDLLPQYSETWKVSQKTLTSGVNKLRSYAKERPAKIIGYTRDALKLDESDLNEYFGDAIAKIRENQ